jgi:hypothetical protein
MIPAMEGRGLQLRIPPALSLHRVKTGMVWAQYRRPWNSHNEQLRPGFETFVPTRSGLPCIAVSYTARVKRIRLRARSAAPAGTTFPCPEGQG